MVSLKAKNPFGQDIEILSGKTWLGVGAAAILVAGFVALLAVAKNASKGVTSSIDGLHARLGEMM